MRVGKLFFVVISFSVFIFACKKDKNEDAELKDNFDKGGMLTNIANNIILPNYKVFQVDLDSLQQSAARFTNQPDAGNLSDLQNKFKVAYRSYQWCSTYEFGPAETYIFRTNLNTFPCDTVQIKSNIIAGSYDLTVVSNLDAKGLPALDYLLFNINSDNNKVLELYTTSSNAANAKKYLNDIISESKTVLNNVINGWSSYVSIFVSSTGSDIGSSTGLLVNQLNFDFEILKNFRIGIPLGKKNLGTPMPNQVEALYSGISMDLALEHINAIQYLYLGKSKNGSDGIGLDDYLVYLQSPYSSGLLSDAIKNRLNSCISQMQLIPNPLSAAVVNNTSLVDAAYNEIQQQVILFKVDMPSALGILITYQDNDGD